MSQPSNLLILMSDEHQARAMGCAGHEFVKTPHLDSLAGRGTLFENAYTPSPICVPARAAFASGQYVHQTRLWDNAMPYTGQPPGWGHALQQAGIPVESIGKLHYRSAEDLAGFDKEHIPMMVAGGVGMVWGSIRREDQRPAARGRMLGDYVGPGESRYTEYDRAVVARTKDWFAEQANKQDSQPWCLFVGLVAPHFPLVVGEEYFNLYPLDQLPEAKLSLAAGYARHPWVEKQNAQMDSEALFADEQERLRAFAAYYGLCSWLDHNIGQILTALEASGLAQNTTIIYCSDHGDNLGTRGLWGKSTLYQESTNIPMIAAGPGFAAGRCATPVSLLDLSATIPAHFDVPFAGAEGVRPLHQLAAEPEQAERVILSEYHAFGSVSGAFMVRKGRWKYHHYIGFPAELFDLETDPEETRNLAADTAYLAIVEEMEGCLRAICTPEDVDRQAFADQDALIEGYGGVAAAQTVGTRGATPPPK
jgi:choline-sulfatase